MQIELKGCNIGIFALGRVILTQEPKAKMAFRKGSFRDGPNDLWKEGVEYTLEKISRFGRVAIMLDHNDLGALEYFKNFDLKTINYHPQEPKRAEKEPVISVFETSCLKHLAMEGWGESVEFRRIARKFLRKAKHHRCDTIFFPERILAEESTQKTLQHLAGTQIKVITVADVLKDQIADGRYKISGGKKQKLIFDKGFTDFELKRAGEILKMKLPKNPERT